MKKKAYNIFKCTFIFILAVIFAIPTFADNVEESEVVSEIIEDSENDLFLSQSSVDIFDPIFDDFTVSEKIEILREIFPHDMYWNQYLYDGESPDYLYISGTSCNHDGGADACNIYNGVTREYFPWANNIQCLGFASMISDFLFGKDAAVEIFYDYESLDVGDHIRLISLEHSMIVTEKTESYIKAVECNADYNTCVIKWDREISKDTLLYNWGEYEFIKRIG